MTPNCPTTPYSCAFPPFCRADYSHYGYMAQEVEQVFPYAVHTLNDGYKVINYGAING